MSRPTALTDNLNIKHIKTHKQSNIKKLYNRDIMHIYSLETECDKVSQIYTPNNIYKTC